jgi:hypothetical protein
VLLVAGLDAKAMEAVEKGAHHGGQHLQQVLRFVAMKQEGTDSKRAGHLQMLGGPWDQELDGGSPER